MRTDSAEYAIVGRVRKAHGIRGEVAVELLTDAPEAIFASGRRVFAGTVDGDPAPPPGMPRGAPPQELLVRGARPHGEALLVTFAEIPDRTAAELWRDRYLLVPVDEIAAPGEGEVFLHDLVGLRAVTEGGDALGEVTGFYELPHQIVLELRTPRGDGLIPFVDEMVLGVDVAAGTVTVRLPDGLLP